ncbi:MAG TPA: hypothetical protein VK129_07035 [Terriglobales bacterium]|nr:hypothetical protein [Terriglobales bacterium]
MPLHSLARLRGLRVFSVVLFLIPAALAQVEVAKLRPELVWQRTSPTRGATEGPVLYTIIMRSSATPNTIPKIGSNYTLTNSLITDNGTIVAIGGFSVDSTGLVTFKNGQTFPGTGNGTITGVTAGTGLSGGGSSGNVTLNNAGVLGITAADSSVTLGGTAANPTLAVNTATSDTRYVLKAGDTMIGTLNLPGNGLVAGGSQLVLSGGNVGIGTGGPNAQLQVIGRGGTTGIGIGGPGGPGDSGLNAVGGPGGQGIGAGSGGGPGGSPSIVGGVGGSGVGPVTGGTGGSPLIAGGAGGSAIGAGSSNGNGGSVFIEPGAGTAFGNVLIADVGGNVGVGTVSPGQKLDVSGNINASGSVNAASFTGIGAGLTSVTASGLTCTGCITNTHLGVNYAGSASQGGAATNALALGGNAAASYSTTAQSDARYLQLTGGTLTGNLQLTGGGIFTGDGSGLINLNATNLASGTVPVARLSSASTGTAGIVLLESSSSDTNAAHVVLANDTRLSDARTPTAGSSSYIQNTTSPQTANMNITGNAAVGGTATVSGNVFAPQLSGGTNGSGSALTVNAASGTGNGGVLNLSAGNAGTANGGAGGDLNINAGNAAVIGGAGYGGLGPAGKVNITAGSGYNSVGADVILKSGTNSNWSLSTPGTHSNVSLQGGGLLGADGAVLTVEGAGNGCSNNCSATFGGNVRITGGTGFGGDPGGSIILTPGSPSADVHVVGNLSVTGSVSKGSGSFKIDHPLDPANKYLSHSFVESPDMMNVYNGNVLLDVKGEAWVSLPDYFEALNQDFRYQLTPIGAPGQHILYIDQEIANNRFKIAGGKPGGKVSWQVTGVRHDAYANAHRIPVEEDKGNKRGTYLHPELFQQQQQQQQEEPVVAAVSR